ncbi:PREDICTED: uncharacterized protein LOC109214869 [Nicotiana attenuata]|uniref:uncharacterized protein LOC109214869 n=1 Tax=Nicotiana attenuata TaxID=49451 RepID=UPI0009057002|nr:PREDICTED: uncharacterized protein LOC109214869 [Nicotiana attenuata]
MTGILTEVAVHKLSLDPNMPPMRQKKRPIAEARNKFVKKEVTRLLDIRSIREVKYPDFLANVVVVCYHLKHLQETFDVLRKHNMKPNPEKYAFGVSPVKFLGFLVSQRGIEVNLDKIKAIEDISDHQSSVKEVQRLTRRLDALSKFSSWSSEKCHSSIALKKKNNFEWTSECQMALRDLKRYLSSPLLLSKPKEGETLLFYLAVSEVAVSAVLVSEDEGMQSPIYYISKILTGAKTLYLHLEKVSLTLVVTARKLRPYFQCHPIAMVTTFPLRNILHKPELSGRLAKWVVEMSEFDIEYKLRTAIKSQVLSDCVADFSPGLLRLATKKAVMVLESTSGVWTLFMDGASNVKGFGLGILLTTPSGETLRQAIRTVPLTNNEAEYEALIAGLELARGLDFEVYGIFETKEERMKQYVVKVQALLARFSELLITHISREENVEADALANLGSSTEMKASESGTRNEIIDYLEHGKLLEDAKASWALRAKAARYSFKKGQLYRKSFQGPLARCLGVSEANYVMREVHEGIYGNHSGADSLVLKLIRPGYYWPCMEQDAKTFVQKCDKRQRYAPLVHQPAEPLHSVLSPWTFMKWGMDIVGPRPPAPG